MIARTITVPTTTPAYPMPGSQVSGDQTCCSLDTLVQPHFFCGQLLTDQDLMSLLRWGQDKLRLARYRHGWGVVCGLDVHCVPQQADQVMVSPGYAISCCGDDIVVALPYSVNLADVCRSEPDPCEPRMGQSAQGGESPPVTLFGCSWPADEIRVVELVLHYREEGAEPQTPLGRNACSQLSACEYGRMRETHSVTWHADTISSDPVTAAAERWRTAYRQSLAVVPAFLDWWRGQQSPNGKDVRKWLLDWIKKYPLHQFCSLWDCLCTMEDAEFTEARVAQIIFWLALDYRNAFLACDCYRCLEGQGVPLARVWLRVGNNHGQRACHVLAIDTSPPYRRLLSPECWPAPLGQANVGPVIWRRVEEACAVLTNLGIRVHGDEPYPMPTTVSGLAQTFGEDLFLSCGQGTVVQWVDMGPGWGRRVVGFRSSGD